MIPKQSEKQKVMKLLLSGQKESIQLGLTIAESLQINLQDIRQDMAIAFGLISNKVDIPFAEQVFEIINATGVVLRDQSILPQQIVYFINLKALDGTRNHFTSDRKSARINLARFVLQST